MIDGRRESYPLVLGALDRLRQVWRVPAATPSEASPTRPGILGVVRRDVMRDGSDWGGDGGDWRGKDGGMGVGGGG